MGTATSRKDCSLEHGDLIFQDGQDRTESWLVLLFCIVLGLVIAIIGILIGEDPDNGIVLGACTLIFGVSFSVLSYLSGSGIERKLCLYENAIVEKDGGTTKTLLFEELKKFQCERTPTIFEGQHIADEFEMTFETRSGTPEDTISYSAERHITHFDRLLDFVCEKMSQHMAADLSEHGSVEWVDTVSLARDGINANVDYMNSLTQRFVAWSEIREFDIVDGELTIKLIDSNWSAIKLDSNAPNFYPGYSLFLQLYGIYKGTSLEELAI